MAIRLWPYSEIVGVGWGEQPTETESEPPPTESEPPTEPLDPEYWSIHVLTNEGNPTSTFTVTVDGDERSVECPAEEHRLLTHGFVRDLVDPTLTTMLASVPTGQGNFWHIRWWASEEDYLAAGEINDVFLNGALNGEGGNDNGLNFRVGYSLSPEVQMWSGATGGGTHFGNPLGDP